MPRKATAESVRPPDDIEDPKKNADPPVRRLVPVLNNRLGPVQISSGRGPKGAFDGGHLILLRVGQNLVPEEKWDAARKQRSVRRLLSTKIKRLGAMEDQLAKIGEFKLVEGKPVAADSPLLEMSEEEALGFIEDCGALELLKELVEQDAPAIVLQAITRKIKDIEAPKNRPAVNRQVDRAAR